MSENIVCKTAVVANITEISTKQLCEFSDKQILRLSEDRSHFWSILRKRFMSLSRALKNTV